MLKALGFENDTYLYVASGEIYGGEKTLQPLKNLFPNYYTKEMLADPGELEPLLPFSSRLAALDFIVSDESDVFVTNNNGNMAKILAGRRSVYFTELIFHALINTCCVRSFLLLLYRLIRLLISAWSSNT